jgi:excisionase family DNA binding protein
VKGNAVAIKRASDVPVKPTDLAAPFFSIPEVAWLMKCSVPTVRRRIRAGYPHSQQVKGGVILISREDLDYYYAADRTAPPAIRRGRIKSAA